MLRLKATQDGDGQNGQDGRGNSLVGGEGKEDKEKGKRKKKRRERRTFCDEMQDYPSVHATILFFRNKMMAWPPPKKVLRGKCYVLSCTTVGRNGQARV